MLIRLHTEEAGTLDISWTMRDRTVFQTSGVRLVGMISRIVSALVEPAPVVVEADSLAIEVDRFSEFGDDGGPAAKAIVPKFSVFSKHVTAHTGFQVPKFEIKLLVAGAIAVKGFGSLLFIFGSTIGAFLLILHQLIATPILYDFYNYDTEKKEFTELFIKFTQTSHGQFDGSYGFTLVFTTQACKRPSTGLVGVAKTQNLALLGALMFFIGMKSTTPRRSGNKKRHSKSKAA
ncbi:HR-like lesion-inducer [Tanacetum coccineum]